MHTRQKLLFAATTLLLAPAGCSDGNTPAQVPALGTGGIAAATGGGAMVGAPPLASGGAGSGGAPAVGSGGTAAGGAAAGGAAAGGATAAGGSNETGGGPAGETYLGLPALTAAEGFQLRSAGVDVPAGEELEFCEIGRLPGGPADVFWVNEYELGNAKGSHHFIMNVVTPGTAAEEKVKALKVGERVPCVNAQATFGESGVVSIAGIQTPHDKFRMAPGVGKKFFGGQYAIFDYHFMNSTDTTIQARSAINFHLVAASEVKHESLGLSILNYTIDTPAKSSKSFTAECHMKDDVMVGLIARHTHAYGTDFDVWYSGGSRDGQHIWTSKHWEEETQYRFPEPVLMRAGEGFRFRCGFDNTTSKELRFGTSATDEMCILFGNIWEARDGQGLKDINCSIIWVDSAGVAHPADEAGGIPPAPPLTAATCSLATASLTSWDADCKACTCNVCGAQSVTCALDADCGQILNCLGSCAPGEECMQKCESTLEEHSSGAGLAMQAQGCLKAMCKTCPL